MYCKLSMLKRGPSQHVIEVGWSLLRSWYDCKHVVVVSALMLEEFDITWGIILYTSFLIVYKYSQDWYTPYSLFRSPAIGQLLLE